jgi:uncharacterized protein (TIGR02271 family)
MTNVTSSDLRTWIGRTAYDRSGDKVGKIEEIYADDHSGEPEWFAVSTGLFGSKVSFVPLEGANLAGDDVTIAFTKDQVKNAPNAEADGHLSEEEERRLYDHYGWSDTTGTAERDVDGMARNGGRSTGRDTSGPETDDAMTRSEEELRVGTHTREAGRARLRKWIETENVNVTVPVKREKARVVVEPITEANVGAAMRGGDLTTEEHEVTLSEEVVDVDKRVVPKERVSLETDVETREVPINEEVRKERIELENDDTTARRAR